MVSSKAMKLAILIFLALLLPASVAAAAECGPEQTCVENGDLADLLTVAQEMHCMKTTNPTFYTDSITIVTDEDGRVYYSGAAPHPFMLRMTWCGFTMEA